MAHFFSINAVSSSFLSVFQLYNLAFVSWIPPKHDSLKQLFNHSLLHTDRFLLLSVSCTVGTSSAMRSFSTSRQKRSLPALSTNMFFHDSLTIVHLIILVALITSNKATASFRNILTGNTQNLLGVQVFWVDCIVRYFFLGKY
jgi:hypothetical protein